MIWLFDDLVLPWNSFSGSVWSFLRSFTFGEDFSTRISIKSDGTTIDEPLIEEISDIDDRGNTGAGGRSEYSLSD